MTTTPPSTPPKTQSTKTYPDPPPAPGKSLKLSRTDLARTDRSVSQSGEGTLAGSPRSPSTPNGSDLELDSESSVHSLGEPMNTIGSSSSAPAASARSKRSLPRPSDEEEEEIIPASASGAQTSRSTTIAPKYYSRFLLPWTLDVVHTKAWDIWSQSLVDDVLWLSHRDNQFTTQC